MLKKLSLQQFNEQQLDNWGAAIRFGSTDRARLSTLYAALYFLGTISILSILFIPPKYDFSIGWIGNLTLIYTLLLFIYMAIILILTKRRGVQPKIEILNTLGLGGGTFLVVLFFFTNFLLTVNVFFADNSYKDWILAYKKNFSIISTTLFLLLFVILFLGYSYDILYRTKRGKIKKLNEKDRAKGEKLKGYASIGALVGILGMKLLTPNESFIAIISLFFSYLLMFFVPRVFILTYLKIRFPEKYLNSGTDNEH